MRQPLNFLTSFVVPAAGAVPIIRRAQRLLFMAVMLAAFVLAGTSLYAQSANRITEDVDATQMKVLPHHLPPWANPINDAGAMPSDLTMGQMTIVLSRSPEQEAAFEKLLADQQNPTSPDYHRWLTPAQTGERFGISQHDIANVTAWLESQGLRVNWVSPSKIFIGFEGTAEEVGSALHTELHYYRVKGEQRFSVSSDPRIPKALLPVIKAIRGLNTIDEKPLHQLGLVHSASPAVTFSSNNYVSPADFATIYDLPSNLTGAGETIGIVGESRTDFADFTNFRALTESTFSNPTEIVPTAYGGVDPGAAYKTPPAAGVSTGNQGEATLDVTRAGTVAPGAKLLLVVASSASGGIADDAQYLVETTPVPAQVMTISFGACESEQGASGVDFWDTLFQQAAGEGISVFVASGDAGASGCDSYNAEPPASPKPNSPNYICSSSYATCVGGTEFNDAANPSLYWSSTNSSDLGSALSYIPEGAWNEPLDSNSNTQASSSGGGVSTVISTPSWQTGTGVPSARSGRYTPDIAFSSAGHDGYFGCFAAGAGSCVVTSGSYDFEYFLGTSAASPDMAGITALLDQKMGAAQGSFNSKLYQLAASTPAAFHDVTVASSGVTSCSVKTPSMCNNSIPSQTGLSGGQDGFLVTTGFDEATGLGSLDVQAFIDAYAGSSPTTTPTVTVTLSSSSITTSQALTVMVAVSGGSSNPTPTGSVTLTSGTFASGATTLSSGNATITVPAGSLATGSDILTVNYTPDTASSSIYNSATGTKSVKVTAPVPPSFTITGTPLSISPGAATGNTSTITVTPAGGLTGSVALTAVITSSPAGAQDLPTLSFGTTSPVSISGTSPATATLTVNTTAATTSSLAYPNRRGVPWYAAGGATLACILLFGVPARRRFWRTMLGVIVLLVTFTGSMLACGGGGGGGGGGTSNPGTTAGSYTITVTGTSGTTTETGTVTLTVQ